NGSYCWCESIVSKGASETSGSYQPALERTSRVYRRLAANRPGDAVFMRTSL
uniref:N-acetyltransferase n=1 Tax=Mesocestoides corti TaxID=53468 RepID=A0A5K3ETN0_MESCO